MKIAIPTKNWQSVAGHAGQARSWLVYDFGAGASTGPEGLPQPARIELEPAQVLHHFEDDCPHPLDGVSLVIAASAGEGFIRHMEKRGAGVLLTGECNPDKALIAVLSGEVLPEQRFDITTSLCKLRDLFSRH